MARFQYEAKKGPKEIIKGIIEARGEDAAVDKLQNMGLVPIRVFAVKAEPEEEKSSKPQAPRQPKRLSFFSRISSRDITIFTEQMASLIKSKVPILEALTVLTEQTENAHLKKVVADIQKQIRDGRTLSQSLARYPHVFTPLYINMIASGEAGGVLENSLMRLVNFRNKEEEIRSKITSALAYPAFIIFVGIATVFVLLGFVIPKLSVVFEEIGQDLPLPTRILLNIGDFVKNYWLGIFAGFTFLILVLSRRATRGRNKIIFDRMKLTLPVIGDFMKKHVLARFARTLAILLGNGIPLFQALKITIPTLDNEVFQLELQKIHKNIVDGLSLEQSLRRSVWFPSFLTNMIAVGEKGGNLEETLLEAANFYERAVDKTTKVMTSLLEPVIILVMGLVVGFIVFAMLLPIFSINLGM